MDARLLNLCRRSFAMSEVYHATQLPLFSFTKVCPRCDPPTEKPLDEFYRNKRVKDGCASYCKVCQNSIQKAYYQAHRDHLRERHRQHYYANLERYQHSSREYRKAHPEQLVALQTAWNKSRRQYLNEYMRRRYALKNELTVGEVDYQRILERDGLSCYICEQAIDPKDLHFDHVIPLLLRLVVPQGAHIEHNIMPAHARCSHRTKNLRVEHVTPSDRLRA